MKRMKKRISICRIALPALLCILLAVFSEDVFAARTGRFLECLETGEGWVKLYCTDFPEEKQILPEQFSVSLASQEAPVTDISTIEKEGSPVTVYCLVDVSGSMNEEQITQAKETLAAVCGGLKDGDNMVIGSLGNDLSASDFLTDKNEILALIEGICAGNEDTNLYKGIVNSLNALKESIKANRKKCLLILSDGEDDQKSGITQSEARAAIKDASIPVYTVATLKSFQSDEEIASAKLLGSFARISAGGRDYAPAIEGMDAAAVGERISGSLNNGIVLTLDTSKVEPDNKDTLLLRVVYTSQDQSVREDTKEVFTEDLLFASENIEETLEATEAVDDTENIDEPQEKEFFSWRALAGIVLGAFAVIAVLALVLRKRKEAVQKSGCNVQEEGEAQEKGGSGGSDSPLEFSPIKEVRPKEEPVMREVRFKAIGYEDICIALQMEEGRVLTIGRDGRADLILNPQDGRLSGVHCKVQCHGDTLRIWDMDSTNGTFVNGIPLKKIGTAVLEEGQSVRMESYEYRISITGKGV